MKKHRFRAMTWEEVCNKHPKCVGCPAAVNPICAVIFSDPAQLYGKYILKEVKE